MLRLQIALAIVMAVATGCAGAPTGPLVHGKYRLTPSGQTDAFQEPADRSAVSGVFASGGQAGDAFAGTDRRDAKTSISAAGLEAYSTVSALRSSLPSDENMLGLGITRDPTSRRSPEEDHNVTVGGFIYAIHKESDNDFHLIVGDQGCHQGGCFVNVEVSGLPKAGSPSRAALSAVRAKFLDFFGGTDPGTSGGYEKCHPPIPVTLTGSIFFDVDHKAGVVGPAGFKPNSAWEIHPLTDIAFEQ